MDNLFWLKTLDYGQRYHIFKLYFTLYHFKFYAFFSKIIVDNFEKIFNKILIYLLFYILILSMYIDRKNIFLEFSIVLNHCNNKIIREKQVKWMRKLFIKRHIEILAVIVHFRRRKLKISIKKHQWCLLFRSFYCETANRK